MVLRRFKENRGALIAFFTDLFKNEIFHLNLTFFRYRKQIGWFLTIRQKGRRDSLLPCPGKTQLRRQKIALILLIN
jgi:hypothetical protein